MAATALQPIADKHSIAKAAVPKAIRGPPAKARGARPRDAKAQGVHSTGVATKTTPKPKQTATKLQNDIADASGLLPQDAKKFLEALHDVAVKNIRDTSLFNLHGMVIIRMRTTPARSEKTKSILGKEVVLQAKPAGHKLTAIAVKPLYEAVLFRD